MAYLYYVAVCGIFDNVKRTARLDRSMGALCYPSIAKAGAEKHLATLLTQRDFVKVGPAAPVVVQVKVGGSGGAKVGATEIAAMFSAKGQGLVGSPKVPAKVASAIAKGIASQSTPTPPKAPTSKRKEAKAPAVKAEQAEQVEQVEPVTTADAPTVDDIVAMGDLLLADSPEGRAARRASRGV